MKKIYTVAKYAKSIMLAAVMTASALTTANAQEADNTTYAPAEANSWWRGEEVTGEEQQVYVYNVGAGIFVTTDDTPSEKISTMLHSGHFLTTSSAVGITT